NATTGAFVDQFVPTGSGGLSVPIGFSFGPDSNLYVANFTGNGGILRYNGTTGAFMDVFVAGGSGGLDVPADVLFVRGPAAAVPEPGAMGLLLAAAFAGTVFSARRKRAHKGG